jgi:hypothetical protein
MIIGICGFQGSGKSIMANYLVDNYNFTVLSFADSVKDMLSVIFNWDRELLDGTTEMSRIWRETVDEWWSKHLNIPNFTPRMAMQYIATDLFRDKFNPNIWILSLENKIKNTNTNIVIPDCRFINEIELVKRIGGHIVYIDRNNPEWFYNLKTYKNISIIPSDIHKSEYEWILNCPNDYIINNNTIKIFYNNIDDYLCKFI